MSLKALSRGERGSVFVEYVLVLCTVAVLAALASFALGPELLALVAWERAVLSFPMIP